MNSPTPTPLVKLLTAADFAEHAKFSPSGSRGWMACAGRNALEAFYPNRPSEASDSGTACHAVAAWCLLTGFAAADRVGQFVLVSASSEDPRYVVFTDDLADMVQGAVDDVRALIAGGRARLVLVERRVDFSHLVGLKEQFGTLDVGLLLEDGELVIIDFKFGYHPVDVVANSQLLIYAAALHSELSLAHEVTGIRLVIVQPRAAGTTEWQCSVDFLLGEFVPRLQAAVKMAAAAENEYAAIRFEAQTMGRADADRLAAWERTYLHPTPNEDDCRFCRAMSGCTAYMAAVERTVGASFKAVAEVRQAEDLLARPGTRTERMRAVAMVEDWCKAVRSEMESYLLAGGEDPEFGLELGRKGPRKFTDPDAVIELLRKQYRLKMAQVYDMTLKTPTQIEKLTKPMRVVDPLSGLEVIEAPILKPKRWETVVTYITQAEPKPSVKSKSAIKVPFVARPDAEAFSSIPDNS